MRAAGPAPAVSWRKRSRKRPRCPFVSYKPPAAPPSEGTRRGGAARPEEAAAAEERPPAAPGLPRRCGPLGPHARPPALPEPQVRGGGGCGWGGGREGAGAMCERGPRSPSRAGGGRAGGGVRPGSGVAMESPARPGCRRDLPSRPRVPAWGSGRLGLRLPSPQPGSGSLGLGSRPRAGFKAFPPPPGALPESPGRAGPGWEMGRAPLVGGKGGFEDHHVGALAGATLLSGSKVIAPAGENFLLLGTAHVLPDNLIEVPSRRRGRGAPQL